MNETDRELLELAAKAAGYAFKWESVFGSFIEEVEPTIFDEGGFGQFWNPLTDDGDALRLIVACKLDLYQGFGDSPEVWVGYHLLGIARQKHCCEEIGSDAAATTRRAIVHAAAEIGKAMP